MMDGMDDAPADATGDALASLGPDDDMPIPPADRSRPIPISDSQLGIWFFETHARGSAAVYQIPTLVELRGRLDVAALRAAVQSVVDRHEILRCGIADIGGEIVLRPGAADEVSLPVESVREDEVAARVAALAAVPFVFDAGPLVRWRLFAIAPERHQLLILQHHIVSDGWSVGILVNELLETYVRGAAGGPAGDVEAPALHYADYAAWSRSSARQEAVAAATEYWTEALSGVPVLELPIDHPRPTQPSGRGRFHHFRLPAPLVHDLRRFARSRRVTPYAVLFAAHALLLARYAGQRDFVVAMPTDGRTRPEFADMLGCFINVLPIRCRIDPSAGFGALVDATFDSLLNGATYQDAPFHRIVARLGASEAARDAVMAKLFRSIFVLDSFNRDRRFEAEGLSASFVVEADQPIAKTDLGFALQEVGEEIAVKIEYAADLFEPDKIGRMAGHFVRLLALGMADAEKPVGRLPLLSEAEFSRLVVAGNRTATTFPDDRSLANLFDEAVRRHADRPAFAEDGAEIDYATLGRRVDAFARVLLAAGLARQERVGILLERGLDGLIAILGTIKAGGVYVPVDPTYPPERIDMILDDAGARIVVVPPDERGRAGAGRTALSVRDEAGEAGVAAAAAPRLAGDVAYVCYTSGTTGRPRGVAIRDRSVTALVWETNYLRFRPDLRIGFASNLVFDAVTLEIWGALLHGGCLVQVPRATLLEVDALSHLLHAERVDVVILTAALFHRFAEERPGAFGGMEAILTGGAVVNPTAVARVLGADTPPQSVLNCYGPTETTTIVATHRMRPGEAIDEARSLPIGRAIANAHLYIVDAEGEPVPVGVPGELLIGGAGVAQGYLNQPALNDEKFIELHLVHPELPDAPVRDRVYRSGDLARWRDDGLVEFIGRADRQIKLRGFRVELGEIEAAILAHRDISDAIVVPRGTGADLRLDAYYAGEAAPTAAVLRAALGERLPGYMIPHRFVRLAAMPVNVAGKIDMARLPDAPEPEEATRPAEVALSPEALVLREIFADVLGCAPPDADDDFFALGGDSIQSIRVAGRARDCGLSLTVRDIFEHRSVGRLAAMLRARAPAAAATAGQAATDVPLTPIQRAFFDLDLPRRDHLNLALLLKAAGRLDAARMQRAVDAVVAAHEALRSRWPAGTAADGGARRQIILPPDDAGEVRVALHTLGDAAADAGELERVCTRWQAGFDIERGPILAVGIIGGHADGCDRLFLAVHHLAVDVVSLWVLVEHLRHAYDSGLPPPAPEAGAAWRWSRVLAQRADAAATARELPHWRDAVAAPRVFAETRLSAPRFERRRAAPGVVFDAAAEAGRAVLGLRPHEVLTATAAIAFATVAGTRDIGLAVEGHGRDAAGAGDDLSRTIGWFTAVYPCRIRLPEVGDDDLLDGFAAAKDALRAVPDNGIGFGLLRYLATDEAASAGLRGWISADLSVNYIGGFDVAAGDWRLEDDAPGATVSPDNQPPHALDLTAFHADGAFVVALIADGRRVEPGFADAFVARLFAVLERFAAVARGAARRVTAADHPLSGLDRATLARLLGPEGSAGRKVLRLTPAEEGMLFEALRRPESNAYTIQIHWRHDGALDVARLRAAFEAIMARHEALRARYVTHDVPHPVRVIEPHAELGWRVLDWRGMDDAAQAAARARFLDEDRRRSFDLTRPGGLRVAVIRRGETAWEIFWTIHHIYFDGWSVSVVLTELAELYDRPADGTRADADPPPAFEGFLRHLLETPEGPGRAFWSVQLAGLSAATDLPFRKPGGRLEVPGADGASARIGVPIPVELAAAVEALSSRHAVTHSTVFQFAWALLLGRCARSDDVVFGTTVSGRTAPVAGIENLVGLAIATVPVRVQLDEGASALASIRAVHATLSAIEEHAHRPLTDLQRLSAVPAGERLFHSLFVFENYPWHRIAGGGSLRFDGLELLDKTEMPLTLLVILQDQPRFEVAFDPTLFDAAGVERLCAHILTVLRGILAAPEGPIGAIDIVVPEERRDLLSTWNDTRRDVDLSRTVLDLFAARAAADPERIAVDHGGATLTYRALDQASADLARRIRGRYRAAHGAAMPAETIVALVLERGLPMIVAILATMRAGGAYLPIDTDDPLARIGFLVEDADAPFILADRATARARGLREAFGARLIVVDEDADGGAEADEALPAVRPGQLAYVIYTSGSTGRPKGTLIEHRGIVNRLAWVQGEYFALTEDDRVLQKTPYTFDVSVWELFWPLVHGARLVFADPGGHREPAYLHRVIRDAAITVVHFVPSMLQIFVEHPGLETLRGLRLIAASGEGLPSRLSARVLAALPQVTMLDLYGPTEATIEVGGHRCSPADEAEAAITPVGRPAWNTDLHILDGAGRLMPVGVAGELNIGGVQVARGYLNQPALTAERFVANPYGEGRLYRTGDLVRRRADGVIDYLGRIDFQMKIRGMRVEPGEIETALEACPGVGRACVIALDDGATLAAAITGDAPMSDDDMRARLAAELPAHMVPARIIRLPALPLTSSGKVDRRRLAGLVADEAGDARPAASVEPLTATAEIVAGVFSEVLKAGGRIDADLSFFALGGHSLTAMRAAMRLSERLGIEVPVRLVFDHPTVRALGAALDRLAPTAAAAAPLARVGRDGWLMPSHAQARVLFLDGFADTPGLYLVPTTLRIDGAFDDAAFARAAEGLVAAHEILRTRYGFVDGAPAMRVAEEAVVDLEIVDLPEDALAARLAREANTGFALDRDPPIRFRLFRLAPRARVLVITLHHVVIDGWSLDLLLADLSRRYAAARRDVVPDAPPPALTYIDFAAWQRAATGGQAMEDLAAYWRARLADAPLLDLPTDRPRPPVATYRGGTADFALDRAESEQLRQFCERGGCTLFPVLLAAWAVVLSRYAGQQDLVIGTPVASRPIPEAAEMIGLFQNTIPLRVALRDDEAVITLASRLAGETREDFARQDLPFQLLIEALGVARDPSRAPLFQAMLILAGSDPTRPGLVLDDATVTVLPVGSDTAKVDLTAAFAETADGLACTIEYASDLYRPETMARLCGHLATVLRAFAADPFARVGDIDILTEGERDDLLGRFNATAHPVDASKTVLDAFAAQVAARGEAVAAVHGAARLTYRALDDAADALARAIRAQYRTLHGRDMPAETVVALVLERGLAMIVSILAVMKAGGAYLPIDPEEAPARTAFMMEDAGAALVVSVTGLAASPAVAGCDAARVICADAPLPEALLSDAPGPLPAVQGRRLAYVIYTSGSTGRPKATPIEHRSLMNRMAWVQGTHPLSPEDGVLQKTPYTFDVSISELIWPLTAGARVVFADPGGHRDPAYLHRLIREEAVSVLHFVPSMLQAFAAHPGLETLRSVRLLALIGEALPAGLAARVLAALPGATMVNFYGPTEATIDVSAHVVSARDEADGPVVPIGYPGWNTTLHVLDAQDRLVPVGVPGELHIGGAQLARGYLNRPELVAERFIDNPFGPGRLYRTGDIVRRRADGNLDYLGRRDFQVKVRGMRVETGEVEAVLLAAPGIAQACVVARAIGGETALIAYVGAPGCADEAALAAHLAVALPAHMHPSRIIALPALPLTTSGKVDRGALPDPAAAARPAAGRAAAATATERLLAEVWREVLGHAAFGTADAFFDVGGTSLGAMRVVSAYAARTGRAVPIVAVFRHPTIRDLAAHLDAADGAGVEAAAARDDPLAAARGRAAARQALRAGRRT